jgi:hypothetical protein
LETLIPDFRKMPIWEPNPQKPNSTRGRNALAGGDRVPLATPWWLKTGSLTELAAYKANLPLESISIALFHCLAQAGR